jgi:hypothetical protein
MHTYSLHSSCTRTACVAAALMVAGLTPGRSRAEIAAPPQAHAATTAILLEFGVGGVGQLSADFRPAVALDGSIAVSYDWFVAKATTGVATSLLGGSRLTFGGGAGFTTNRSTSTSFYSLIECGIHDYYRVTRNDWWTFHGDPGADAMLGYLGIRIGFNTQLQRSAAGAQSNAIGMSLFASYEPAKTIKNYNYLRHDGFLFTYNFTQEHTVVRLGKTAEVGMSLNLRFDWFARSTPRQVPPLSPRPSAASLL